MELINRKLDTQRYKIDNYLPYSGVYKLIPDRLIQFRLIIISLSSGCFLLSARNGSTLERFSLANVDSELSFVVARAVVGQEVVRSVVARTVVRQEQQGRKLAGKQRDERQHPDERVEQEKLGNL